MKIMLLTLVLTFKILASEFHLIHDGKTAYCPPTQSQEEALSKKVLQLKLLSKENSENVTELKLEVKFVKCVESKWTQDNSPNIEKYNYLLPDNTPVVISLKYSDFKIMILNENSHELATVSLKNILKDGKETIRVKITNRNFSSLEVAPFVKRSFFVDEKFHSNDLVFFGSYQLSN
jgi:hypothetical protein